MIESIENDKDHKFALKRIEFLWNSEHGTSEEFEKLADLIDSYERENHFIPEPEPEEAIKFRLEQEGKS